MTMATSPSYVSPVLIREYGIWYSKGRCTMHFLWASLVRFNALSRVLEGALQKEGIPNRVLAGHKFFERMEVRRLCTFVRRTDSLLD